MQWFRSYHGAPLDPKLGLIAAKCDVARPVVIALWWCLLDQASQSTPRGHVTPCNGCNAEETAFVIGATADDVSRVYSAFVERGMIGEDGSITAWAARQERASDNSADRVRKHRERKKAQKPADPAPTVAKPNEADVTECNAVTDAGNDVTALREEESRVEKKDINPPVVPLAGDVVVVDDAEKPKKKRAAPRTKLPDDVPTVNDYSKAMAYWDAHDRPDLNPDKEAEKFRAYHRSHGNRMADWSQAWVTWYSNAVSFNKAPATASGRSKLGEAARDLTRKYDF